MTYEKQLIYKHTCIITNESYIGQTIFTMEIRWKQHLKDAKSYKYNSHFHNAIRKYGIENFTSEILEDFIPIQSNLKSKQTLASEREIYYIEKYDTFNNGYNMTLGGGGVLGYSHPIKVIENMSKDRLGHKNNFFGKHHTEEYKMKSSERQKGNNSPFYRIPRTVEVKKKIGESQKGCKNHNAKIINIYDSSDKIMFLTNGDFEKVCIKNDLPFRQLAKSYQNKGIKLYIKGRPHNKELYKFKGWYAKIIN